MASARRTGATGIHVVTEIQTWQTPDIVRWTGTIRDLDRLRLSILFGLLILHLVFAALVAQPGHFSIDEGIYHQMSRALSEGTWPELWNGYAEVASEELRHPLHQVRNGHLVSQYPYLGPVLAWPFYALAGYRGLFMLNAVALFAVAGFCFLAARRLYCETRLAADATILLILCTFIWQYGHAAWPHALSTAFVSGALLLAILAAVETDRARAVPLAAAAGLVLGFGFGTRIDVAFAAPALVVPFLFSAPPRPREAVAALAGMVPGLAVLSITNLDKFGTVNPFSYGSAAGAAVMTGFYPLAGAGIVALLALWLLSRPRAWATVRKRPLAIAAAFVACVVLALALPSTNAFLSRLASGAWQLIVDFRLRAASHLEPGLERGPLGGIVYAGMVKKSLLQSLPWLPAAVLAAAAALRSRRLSTPHQILALAVAGYVGAYSLFAWHGGMSFNLRYFVPILPIFAVYGARALHDLTTGLPAATNRMLLATGGLSVVAWLYMIYGNPTLESQERVILNVPLLLTALLIAALLWRTLTSNRRRAATLAAGAMFSLCLAWSSVMAIAYDFPFAALRRAGFAMVGSEISPHVRADSIVFTGVDTPYFGLLDTPRVRIAAVRRDDFADFPALARYHLTAGRTAYIAFDDATWAEAEERGVLDGFEVVVLDKYLIGTLAALRLRPETAGRGSDS